MNEIEDIIVLSDIHLAAERDRGLFRADGEMTAFLDWVLTDAGPARVVIAGDFLDFLVPVDGAELSYFDPSGAPGRAKAIIEHHEEVFDALARIAASPDHELWIASGNHDPELLFLDVRDVIERRVRRSSRAATVRWSVDGEAIRFRVGDASVLITHGDVFDDWNRVDRGALRRAANRISYGFSRESEWEYKPPVGTRIVIDHLLRLRKGYPWVDVLKPEREAVFPILHQFLTVGEHWKYRDLIRTLIKGQAESWLEEAVRRSAPQKLIRGGGEGALRPRLVQWLRWEDDGGPSSDAALIEKLREVSESDAYFDISAPDESAELLPHFFERGADLLIAGHTHAAKAHMVGDHLYLNSGTWGRLLRLPASDAPSQTWFGFLNELREGRDLGQSRPTFAWSRRRDRRVETRLMSWENGAATAGAAFELLTTSLPWQRRPHDD